MSLERERQFLGMRLVRRPNMMPCRARRLDIILYQNAIV